MSCSNFEAESLEPPPELSEEETFTNEDGDLLRLEKRDGKRVAVKVSSPQQRGARPQGREKECFRCGRKGHIRPNCNWSTHKDGGSPRPAPPPKDKNTKGANSLEEQIDFGSLDICALEPITANEEEDDEGEWTNWDQDPWLLGADPWTSSAKAPPLCTYRQRSPRKPFPDPPQVRPMRESRSVRTGGRTQGTPSPTELPKLECSC